MTLSEEELVGICNALNEIRHGLPKRGIVAEFLADNDPIYDLYQRISTALDSRRFPIDVKLSVPETQSLRRALGIVLQEIEDSEFHTRLGISREAMASLGARLESQVESEISSSN